MNDLREIINFFFKPTKLLSFLNKINFYMKMNLINKINNVNKNLLKKLYKPIRIII